MRLRRRMDLSELDALVGELPARIFFPLITTKRLVTITEITDMRGGYYCVAAWDFKRRRMVRPLPGGWHWPRDLLMKHHISEGAVIEIGTGGPRGGELPHRMEDNVVALRTIKNSGSSQSTWSGDDGPDTADTIEQIFGSNLVKQDRRRDRAAGFVKARSRCPSLYGLRLASKNCEFVQTRSKSGRPKLRVRIDDSHTKWSLPVTSTQIRSLFRREGIFAVQRKFSVHKELHLRIDLARPYRNSDLCSIQLNGVLLGVEN